MDSIIIRNAATYDLPIITDILRETGWFPYMADPDKALEQVEDNFLEDALDENHSVLVAEYDGDVVGYAAVHWLPYLFLPAPEGFISELFVSEYFRGKGIGARLLDEITKRAKERDCARLHLVNGRNRPSYEMRFYHKRGFVERESLANFVMVLKENK